MKNTFRILSRLQGLNARCGLQIGLWVFLLCILMPAAYAERRVALVIGNANYTALGAQLSNPLNDAADISDKLQTLGFNPQDILLRKDLRVEQIDSTLADFRNLINTAAQSDPDVVALVYYSGHGMQVNERNYLPAVDAKISNEFSVKRQSIVLGDILNILHESKTRVNLVFLDSCRDNPFSIGTKSTTRGLTKEEAPSGTWIAYATQYGRTADDNQGGRNGVFTAQLLQHMGTPNITVEQMFKLVAKGVVSTTSQREKKQEPWPEGYLSGDFYFIRTSKVVPSAEVLSIAEEYHKLNCKFGGRVAPLIFKNNSLYTVIVTLIHPNSRDVHEELRVKSQQSYKINYNIGDDWGVKIGNREMGCVEGLAIFKNGAFNASTD